MLTSSQPCSNVLGGSPRLSLAAVPSTRIDQRAIHAVTASVTASASQPLRQRIPPRSWDSHMHVVEPQRFPVCPSAVYQPEVHTLADALSFESALGVENLVFVQPSIYGTDNSCLLAALEKLGGARGRAVVVVDPENIQQETLDHWHTLGVRGLRVNLQSVGKVMDQTELEETLLQHAKIARTRNWILEVYVPLKMIPMLESVVPRLGVFLCIDHFGSPELSSLSWTTDNQPFDPYTLPGFSSLISLLRAGNTYIKLSAPYRLTKDQQMRDLKAMAQEFLAAAPHRVIYATDWPHTRFTGVDISPFTEWCLDMCAHDPELAEKLFRSNTEQMLKIGHD
ncbi:Amidohydrolase 2 [Penicillium macrosclerotiorum]|uniref:Amidohydrolase 2 n=1 Tax=Penicillium macrosclerotiorum TaxID=303699 RepID=UPI002548092B|nr:Amidohydrolase 2 [Penicillium macrosclerotiorum]KAJ5682763.1 Amidohydrolase 2 [Penicillium macrosclerotiorum]